MASIAEKREQSRQLLIETGLKLFSQKGFEATSIRAIAKEAGISLGLMYNYFPGKTDLLRAIFQEGQSDIEATFEQVQESMVGLPGIERHIRNIVSLLKEKREFWRLLHSLRMQSEIVTEMMGSIEQQVAYIQQMIGNNLKEVGYQNPAEEALLLFATLDGMASHYLLDPSYPIDDVASYLIQKYKKAQ
ncbi:TetR/AcrR family transcriptional regulator [Pontibacter cellulosilyticus]|uniref:TetR/AcrR family transcriptional regulator n=1 Tax=Pontibacter cellulosilyticus TaxID=1720253 RepID=A0A923N6G1_9BACT|nr:TetR/AcrR family transcriptional regulator [Pontibacter cellulosilyticus]MBC5991787.1 TetR/AcrR family transcriptional regulator [Pontibacter cellulosilyticus]